MKSGISFHAKCECRGGLCFVPYTIMQGRNESPTLAEQLEVAALKRTLRTEMRFLNARNVVVFDCPNCDRQLHLVNEAKKLARSSGMIARLASATKVIKQVRREKS